MVRLAARQPVLAMADLDQALSRKPNDPEALMRRGELYLSTRDPVRAKADFDAAMKLEPNNSALIAQAGNAYARAGLYEDSIRELDAWIAAHPKDEDLPQALASRCYARATWGKELPTALADCDAAMRKDKTLVRDGDPRPSVGGGLIGVERGDRPVHRRHQPRRGPRPSTAQGSPRPGQRPDSRGRRRHRWHGVGDCGPPAGAVQTLRHGAGRDAPPFDPRARDALFFFFFFFFFPPGYFRGA